jgi:probable HAF family extracellular repeat protein
VEVDLCGPEETTMKLHRITHNLLITTLLCLPIAGMAQQYTLTPLGFAGFSPVVGGPYEGLNNSGYVVGYDNVINGAYIYHAGVVTSLNLDLGDGVAINNSGFAAFRSWGPDLHSYLFTPSIFTHTVGFLTDIGTLDGSGGLNNSGQTVALAMNDSATIVGSATVPSTGNPVWHAFSFTGGHMTDLGTLPQGLDTTAWAINNLGQIVGDNLYPSGLDRAFISANGVMTDLDPGNTVYDSRAAAINDAGQIVVITDLAWRIVIIGRNQRQFIPYRGSTYYTTVCRAGVCSNVGNLGSTLGTYGYSINQAGDAVGYTQMPDNTSRPFLYHAGAISDLNDHVPNLMGYALRIASNINDAGQIVCWAKNPSGNFETVLLTPI